MPRSRRPYIERTYELSGPSWIGIVPSLVRRLAHPLVIGAHGADLVYVIVEHRSTPMPFIARERSRTFHDMWQQVFEYCRNRSVILKEFEPTHCERMLPLIKALIIAGGLKKGGISARQGIELVKQIRATRLDVEIVVYQELDEADLALLLTMKAFALDCRVSPPIDVVDFIDYTLTDGLYQQAGSGSRGGRPAGRGGMDSREALLPFAVHLN